MEKLDKIKKDLKDLEVPIEQYPMAESSYLIEEFLIIGYSDIIKEEKAINVIKENIISKNSNDNRTDELKEFTIDYLPSVLSIITSDTNIILTNEEHLINFAFPIPPKIYYSKKENKNDLKITKILINNIHEDTSNTGYVYSFYEKQIVKINENENIVFYFPTAFMIISQYNYFYCFHKICEYLHNQFLSDKNEIPLEIQVYNIVNFIPCPVNNKFELSLFPNNDLSSIKNCKNFNEYKKNGSNNYMYLEQLRGYRQSDINFCRIFEILTPELLVQIYLQYLLRKNIAIFSEDKEKLHLVVYIFDVFLFPLNKKQNCSSLNPNSYFYDEEIDCCLSAYLCSYKKIAEYQPNNSDKNGNFFLIEDYNISNRTEIEIIDSKPFAFVVDLDEQTMEIIEKPDDSKEFEKCKILFEYFKYLDESQCPESVLLPTINELIDELKNLSKVIKEKKLTSFFIENEETKMYSNQIKEAFLGFNVFICNYYLSNNTLYENGPKVITKTEKNEKKKDEEEEENENENENQQKEELEKIPVVERYFFPFFELSSFDLLYNFTITYNEGEPKMEKASKRGFDNLVCLISENDYNNILIKGQYIELLDCIYKNNEKQDFLTISFFEFYKYFYDNLRFFISRNINDDYIDKKIIKKDNSDNYYYKYKKIIFDKDLLLKYTYYLDELPEKVKQQLFPMSEKINTSIEKIIHMKDYYNSYDKIFIAKKIFNINVIIQYCILNIVVLSISELKLTHFTEPIYSLLQKIPFGLRKYVELILNVSYRVLINKKITNQNEINKYFDIYKVLIEYQKVLPNEEIFKLYQVITEYTNALNDPKYLIPLNPSKLVKDILNTEENNLFKFTPESTDPKEFEQIKQNSEKEGEINKKISLKSDLLNEKEISSDSIYYLYTLYFKLNGLIDKFYESADINSIDKKELKKLIINVIYYLRFVKEHYPNYIMKFLFYCLCDENNE